MTMSYLIHELFIGPPTDPVITFEPRQEDDALDTFICTSNSTTTPKTHNWMLRYFFEVNGNVIGQHSYQRAFVVKENMLFTAKRDLTITCIVQEENSHPISVSTTVSFPGYNCKYELLGRRKNVCVSGYMEFQNRDSR